MKINHSGENSRQFSIKSGLHAGKGLGDLVADFTHVTRLDRIAGWYTDVTGKDCGCAERQEKLNSIMPDIV